MRTLMIAALLCATTLQAAELRIDVEGVEGGDGKVYIAVFDKAERFLKDGQSLTAAIVPARAPVVVFPRLDAGEYAVSVFHDKNGNGKLDSNLVGIPTEPYGFSNNAAGVLGPPSFDAARIELRQDSRIVIRLR